tara:strand:+ start:487 stop:1638 length:1152 start_codon:yes stop_codon:yes gene_type:complete
MVVNIPVKLVRADGQLIALDVTTLTLDVDRNINPHPIPYAGSNRFAFDLNMSKAVILLEGYMVDAPTVVDATGGSKAVSYIDFARTLSGSNTSNTDWIDDANVLQNIATLNTDSFVTALSSDNPHLILNDIDNVSHTIYFVKSNTTYGHNLGSSGKYHVSIIDASGNLRTTANIQTYLTALLNEDAGSSILGTKFSAVAQGAGGVQIKQISNGKAGNNNSPRFAKLFATPHFFTFITGKDSDSTQGMSAGDKVMSLYAILNNSIDVDNSDTRKYFKSNIKQLKQANESADYITGIQIPFNSTVNADGEKYKAMNFFMPTGKGINARGKSIINAQSASSIIDDPDSDSDFSFIKGTITKATFVQIGGEPIYQFNIQFLPIDVII